jgi:hypothetical protein
MKKLTLAISGLVLLAGSAFADSTNIGAKLSYGNFDASGTETQNLTSDPKLTSSGDANFPFASIFLEREKEFTNFNVALGLDFIPLTAEIDKLGGGDGTDATVEVGNQITLYVQPSKELSNGLKVFGKLGYSRMEVDITDITRQATTAGTASTDGNTSKDLDGITVGLGVEKSVSAGPFDFIRLEASYTDYDSISHTNSNSKKLTAEADLTAINLSIGKKF